METLKISVEVCVNLSENTQSFIKSLFGGAAVAATIQAQKPAPAALAKPASPQAPAEAAPSTSKSIEDVRKMLAQKVNEHRDAIKQKLTEFGAPSVTKLDPAKYDEMYNFLESL